MADYILLDRKAREESKVTLDQIVATVGVEGCTIDWAINCDGIFANEDWFVIRTKPSTEQLDCATNGFKTWINEELAGLGETELLKCYDVAIAQAQAEEDQLYYELKELRDVAAQLYTVTGKANWLNEAAQHHLAFIASHSCSQLTDTTGHEELLVMGLSGLNS